MAISDDDRPKTEEQRNPIQVVATLNGRTERNIRSPIFHGISTFPTGQTASVNARQGRTIPAEGSRHLGIQ